MTTTTPTSGRRAQAARNDTVILEAARAVFVADPGAPIAAVARRAGVGISALYRRHGSKEELLHRLCADGLDTYIGLAEQAVADDASRDPGEVFTRFLRGVVDADTHSLTLNLAGLFTPRPELLASAARAAALTASVVERAQGSGVLRADVVPADLGVLFQQVASVHGSGPRRTAELRGRYLALLLDGLRPGGRPLPGPPPAAAEFEHRWVPSPDVRRTVRA